MKNLLLIFLTFSLSASFAQNWALINEGYEYHFSLNGEYNTTVKVDSIEVNTGDTTFFLNRIVSPCDSCIAAGSDEYLHYNQPTFLQRQVLKQGNEFTFTDTTTFVLKPNENLNATWVFDAVNNVSAEIVALNQESIFGLVDSVKTILLSGNDTIKVSKQFGITQFKEFQLLGVLTPNSNFGFKLPTFLDFYNFNVGDVFMYVEFQKSGSVQLDEVNYGKYTIESKQVFSDSIVYNTYHYYAHYDYINATNYFFGNTSTRLVYYKDSYSEAYNHSLHSQTKRPLNYYTYVNPILYSDINCYKNSENLFEKAYGVNFNANYMNPFFIPSAFELLVGTDEPMFFYNSYLTEGLGLRKMEYSYFEDWGGINLIGYIKNGVQTGEVWADWKFTEIKQLENEQTISVFPNPSAEIIAIHFETNQPNVKVICLDHLGKAVLTKNLENQKNIELNIEDFAKGIYFLKLEVNERVYQQKIVVR